MTHDNITKMTPAQQHEESCGSLAPLAVHGHTRAAGLFAYGGNHSNSTIQRDVVSTCFAYGRRYWDSGNVRSEMKPPWFQRTISVNGGRCHDATLPCADLAVRNNRVYTLPEELVAALPSTDDEWTVIQYYRLVSGTTTLGTWSWDCTSPDVRKHWTSDPEIYCYDDFRRVLDAVPEQVATVDPATVAAAWGR
jgi:hypothetical protein